jgi:tetratricopeptide (TPR) repeat protein
MYTGSSALGRAVAVLHKGDFVTVRSRAAAGPDCWAKVTSVSATTGFLRCEDLEIDSEDTDWMPQAQDDPIEQFLKLSGANREIETLLGDRTQRASSNTQRIDENEDALRRMEQALKPAAFMAPVRAALQPFATDERLKWVNDRLRKSAVHKVAVHVASVRSPDQEHLMMPYLTGALIIPASAERIQLLERIETATQAAELNVDFRVARERARQESWIELTSPPQRADPQQTEAYFTNFRADQKRDVERQARNFRLFIYAGLSDKELREYAEFNESSQAKWVGKILQDGMIAGIRAVTKQSLRAYVESAPVQGRALWEPSDSKNAQELFQQGVWLLDKGEAKESLPFFDAAIAIKPDYPIAHYKRGNAHRNLRHDDLALEDYTRAIELDPAMALAYLNRGYNLLNRKQVSQALTDFTAGVRANPRVSALWSGRGEAYDHSQQSLQAVAEFTQALRAEASDSDTWIWRGYEHGLLQEWQRSLDDCETGIRLRPSENMLAGAYKCKGRALVSLHKYAEAIPALTQSIEDEANDDQVFQNRGWAFESTQQFAAALKDYERALQLYPDDSWSRCHHSTVLHSLGRDKEADVNRSFCAEAEK